MAYNSFDMGEIFQATVEKQFRMYIPKSIRERLKLEIGDKIVFEIEDGKIHIFRGITKVIREIKS